MPATALRSIVGTAALRTLSDSDDIAVGQSHVPAHPCTVRRNRFRLTCATSVRRQRFADACLLPGVKGSYMPEGPSIQILREEAAGFAGKTVLRASGNSSIDISRLVGHRVVAVRSWGKHFLIEFKGFSLRIHLLMFGSYRINESKEGATPRLSLGFAGGKELNFYTCSVRLIEEPLDLVYDWSADVLSDAWDP
jgi:hypothetical protein